MFYFIDAVLLEHFLLQIFETLLSFLRIVRSMAELRQNRIVQSPHENIFRMSETQRKGRFCEYDNYSNSIINYGSVKRTSSYLLLVANNKTMHLPHQGLLFLFVKIL